MKNKRIPAAANIPVRVDAKLLSRIKAISTRLGEPQSSIMRLAMRIGLGSLEGIKLDADLLEKLLNEAEQLHSQSTHEDKPKKQKSA